MQILHEQRKCSRLLSNTLEPCKVELQASTAMGRQVSAQKRTGECNSCEVTLLLDNTPIRQ